MASGDFNGDGITDLAASLYGADQASVVLGFGGGVFSAPQLFGVGFHPKGLVAGDFTGGGVTDLVSADYGDDTITVLAGRGHVAP